MEMVLLLLLKGVIVGVAVVEGAIVGVAVVEGVIVVVSVVNAFALASCVGFVTNKSHTSHVSDW